MARLPLSHLIVASGETQISGSHRLSGPLPHGLGYQRTSDFSLSTGLPNGTLILCPALGTSRIQPLQPGRGSWGALVPPGFVKLKSLLLASPPAASQPTGLAEVGMAVRGEQEGWSRSLRVDRRWRGTLRQGPSDWEVAAPQRAWPTWRAKARNHWHHVRLPGQAPVFTTEVPEALLGEGP